MPDVHARDLDGNDVSLLKGFGVDLARAFGNMHHEIAVSSLFLLDRAGVVRWAHLDPDFKVTSSFTVSFDEAAPATSEVTVRGPARFEQATVYAGSSPETSCNRSRGTS